MGASSGLGRPSAPGWRVSATVAFAARRGDARRGRAAAGSSAIGVTCDVRDESAAMPVAGWSTASAASTPSSTARASAPCAPWPTPTEVAACWAPTWSVRPSSPGPACPPRGHRGRAVTSRQSRLADAALAGPRHLHRRRRRRSPSGVCRRARSVAVTRGSWATAAAVTGRADRLRRRVQPVLHRDADRVVQRGYVTGGLVDVDELNNGRRSSGPARPSAPS
jgi:hypothetical protein